MLITKPHFLQYSWSLSRQFCKPGLVLEIRTVLFKVRFVILASWKKRFFENIIYIINKNFRKNWAQVLYMMRRVLLYIRKSYTQISFTVYNLLYFYKIFTSTTCWWRYCIWRHFILQKKKLRLRFSRKRSREKAYAVY